MCISISLCAYIFQNTATLEAKKIVIERKINIERKKNRAGEVYITVKEEKQRKQDEGRRRSEE